MEVSKTSKDFWILNMTEKELKEIHNQMKKIDKHNCEIKFYSLKDGNKFFIKEK